MIVTVIHEKVQTVKRNILVIGIINLFLLICVIWFFRHDRYAMMISTDFDYVNLTEERDEKGGTGEYKASLSKQLFPILNSEAYQLKIKYYTPGVNQVKIYTDFAPEKVIIFEGSLPEDQSEYEIGFNLKSTVRDIYMEIIYTDKNFGIEEMNFQSSFPYMDWLFLAFGGLAAEITLFLVYRKKRRGEEISCVLLVTGAAIFVSLPYLNEYLPSYGHDISFHLARIDGIAEALRQLQIPFRIDGIDQEGYGYASPIFYPSFFLMIPGLLKMLGASTLFAYKFLVISINIATAWIMYYVINRMLHNKNIAALTAVLYVTGIYRLTDIYTRAAIGEVLAMAFLPLIIWGLYEIVIADWKKWIVAVIGFSCILQSHVLSLEICGIFTILFLLCHIIKLIHEPRRIISLIKAGVLTVMLNLWYILPFISYSSLDLKVFNNQEDLHETGIYMSQLFQNFIGFMGEDHGLENGGGEMPLSIGIAVAAGCISFCFDLFADKDDRGPENRIGKGCLGWGMIALFFTSFLFPWNVIAGIPLIGRVFSTVQFAWRYLAVALVLLCIPAGIGYHNFILNFCGEKKVAGRKGTIAVSVGICLLSLYFLDSISAVPGWNKADVEYVGVSNEDALYLFEASKNFASRAEELVPKAQECGKSEVLFEDSQRGYLSFETELTVKSFSEGSYFEVPLYWYPGYYALTDSGEKLTVFQTEAGLVGVMTPEQSCHIMVAYGENVVWKIADWISGMTLLAVLYSIISKKRIRKTLCFFSNGLV